jgi:ADP-ribosyl-[dinitrogen reductase] hydrolase
MRTSLTHPLEIAEVSPGPGLGKVGLTFCPGKHQQNASTGHWERDLGLDLDVVAKWGAAVVVTLIEKPEMERLGVAQLRAEVEARHMVWHHYPMVDGDIPSATLAGSWAIVGEECRAVLRDGFNVLVHCKGGLGRAGTIAATLLTELGMYCERAVELVREARPGAIENRAQEVYAMRSNTEGETLPGDDYIADRALGAMVGLAVGDALGTTLEFSARDSQPRLTDMIGGGPFKLEPGQWTDDAAMALALLDSLAFNDSLDEADLMRRFVAWHEHGEYSCTGRCFDIGMTTRAALARFKQSGMRLLDPQIPAAPATAA